jgi:hypothetical protein
VECIFRIAAVRGRINQRVDYFVELDDRSGPSVGDHQRKRIGMRRFGVDEMDAEAVNPGLELRKAVEPGFARAPVVFLKPIPADLLRIGERKALRPIVDTFPFRPSGGTQPALQVIQLIIGGGNFERRYLIAHRPSLRKRGRTGIRESILSRLDSLLFWNLVSVKTNAMTRRLRERQEHRDDPKIQV